MSNVIFFPDIEEGHVYPSFKIAKNLQDAGYDVWYVGIHDVMEIVESFGFNNRVILKDIYHQGYLKEVENGRLSNSTLKPRHYIQLIKGGPFDEVIDTLKPKLIISSLALAFEAMLFFYKYRIHQIIFNFSLPKLNQPEDTISETPAKLCINQIMNLRGELPSILLEFIQANNIAFKTLHDLASPLNEIPQFLLCPTELCVQNFSLSKKDILIGPCVREPQESEEYIRAQFLSQSDDKEMIFASLGSQISVYPDRAMKFYKILIECINHLPDYHFILSIDKIISIQDLGKLPSNVSIFRWVPQVELLPHISLAIIHGGLGTIKECIYYGVPMLIIPMGRDQKDNAERIKQHGLGLQGYIEDISIEEMLKMINNLLRNRMVVNNIQKLQQIFQNQQERKLDVEFVKNYIGEPD